DLPFNFMDYSSCPHDFTPGQKERMRFMILNVRNSLLTQTTCEQTCTSPAKAGFSFPTGPFITGNAIHFTNTSNGDLFEWSINGQMISTSADLDYIFPHQGWYKIELLARSSAGEHCNNRQVNWIQVFCAVKARITTSKKKVIVDEELVLASTIQDLSQNNSAISFEWYANGELIGNQSTFTHQFQAPGEKIIYLVTRKGTCTDTSNYKSVMVKPLPDYQLDLNELTCQAEKRKLNFTICNEGDTDLPPGLPVSFYDGNPTIVNAEWIGTVFYTNKTIGRYCCESFELELPSSFDPQGSFLYGVVNDNGSLARPYKFEQFPFTGYKETIYSNNIDSLVWNPFSVSIHPKDTMVLIGSVINLTVGSADSVSIKWSTTRGQISCDTCMSTSLEVLGYSLVTATAISKDGCMASDTAHIKIFIDQDIMIPSAFTPNKDNLNDIFYILGSKHVTNISSFSIYNRWGEQVFQNLNFLPNIPVLGWDGRYKGKEAGLGTYVYYCQVEFADGTKKLYKGTVILIR
ncbi:MAG TPA: gliding motility-associated C-terminal domain-containing protein, partial [Flavisolibacter sp.]